MMLMAKMVVVVMIVIMMVIIRAAVAMPIAKTMLMLPKVHMIAMAVWLSWL